MPSRFTTVGSAAFGALLIACAASNARAIEGPSVAGPIGGSDVRVAMLPPPGVYTGYALAFGQTLDFVDKNGNTIPGLEDANLTRTFTGPFAYYVPNGSVLGGSVAIGGFVPAGISCGSLFAGEDDRCEKGFGDPYVELVWAKSFTTPRASNYQGAYPIFEGLSIMASVGGIIPLGHYNVETPTRKALSISTNIWDLAPSLALTYTTPALLADGTELSVRAFWNSYRENPDTLFNTGDVVDVEFALTEHIGRWQIGVTGFYAAQVEGDKIGDVALPPDSAKAVSLQAGGIAVYDMPEIATSFKLKAITSLKTENTVDAVNVVFGVIRKW